MTDAIKAWVNAAAAASTDKIPVRQVDGANRLITPAQFMDGAFNSVGAGTVTTTETTSVAEYGNGPFHFTRLAMTSFALGNVADNAALGLGAKFYTFPAGTILVKSATIVGGITAAVSNTAQTPEVGIGTVVATGAIATLSSTFEDIIDGGAAGLTGGDTVAPNVAGGAFYKGNTFTTGVLIKTSGGKARDLFLNIAATWADVTAAGAATFTGTICLEWAIVS